jgi:hypothetical protein
VLAWTAEWYFRAETLEAANAAIVNYHHRLPTVAEPVFRDRRELTAPYLEPAPSQQIIQARTATRTATADQALARAWRWAGKPSIVLAVLLVVLAGCAKSVSGSFNLGLTAITIVVLCGPGLGYTGWCWLRRDQIRDLPPEQEYRQAMADWGQRAAEHEAAELTRLGNQPEWGTVVSPASRTDIFGGTLAGWQALLTVHGASVLAERPLLTLDLTGQHAAGILTATARSQGIDAVAYHLPQDLGRCGLLTELSPAQLADAIAEAMHAGDPGVTRADRAVDVRIVQQLTGALARGGVTPRRLAAAVRAVFGYPVADGLLSAGEYELIAGDLFPLGYREQVSANLIRLDAVVAELAAYGGDGWPSQHARYTCLVMDTAARSASEEVLSSLIVQWLTVQVTTSTGYAPAVIIAGADEISRPHLERLADACERRGVPLTLMFRHLRNDAAAVLGSGTAVFMRLANHAEAEQAAGYVGHRHTFVVSSFTATRGGNQTSTRGGGDGYGTSDSYSDAQTRGWQGGGVLGGGSSSGGRTRTAGGGTSRNWSSNWSQAGGTSWSDAETRQRTYEYMVEPALLQNLPEYALLLADRSGRTLQIHAVECDPAIINVPGASTTPLLPPGSMHQGSVPPIPIDQDHAGSAIAAAGQYRTGWQESDDLEYEPALSDEEHEPPWWYRNQPPVLLHLPDRQHGTSTGTLMSQPPGGDER